MCPAPFITWMLIRNRVGCGWEAPRCPEGVDRDAMRHTVGLEPLADQHAAYTTACDVWKDDLRRAGLDVPPASVVWNTFHEKQLHTKAG